MDSQPRARMFATFVSILWMAYATGFWYASKFVYMGLSQGNLVPILFSSVVVVWFVAYFAALAWWLIRRSRTTNPSLSRSTP